MTRKPIEAFGQDRNGLDGEATKAAVRDSGCAKSPILTPMSREAVAIPRELFDFLMGTAEIDGTSFGDLHDGLPGRFWWRALLQTAENALSLIGGDDGGRPIPMILHCPKCGVQHIDEPALEERDEEGRAIHWTNPPHRSHLCHGCGCIWRPADVPTNGVARIETVGKADTWGRFIGASPAPPCCLGVVEALEKIARTKIGLQGIMEDYGHDANKLNYHAMEYYRGLAEQYQTLARTALQGHRERGE